MAYDERLAERVGALVARRRDFHQQKMFGGVGFLLRGNMCVGVWKEYLILRLGKEWAAPNALLRKAKKWGRPFDITGRAMKGWVMVGSKGTQSAAALKEWVKQAIAFVSKLPRK